MTDTLTFSLGGLPDERRIREKSDELRQRAEDSEGLIGRLSWDSLRSAAATELERGLAGEDGLKWLSYAWTKADEVKAAAAETLEEGAGDRFVPLASHDFSQELIPVVTLTCGLGRLEMRFSVELKAEVECIDLVLRGGRLAALQAGRLTPSASLSFHGISLGEKKWDPIDFTDARDLPNGGWRIAAPDAP
jgi:hypothetical protein